MSTNTLLVFEISRDIRNLQSHPMECQKINNLPKLMLTQPNFDTCNFEFRFWLSTEYLVDKWHNQYMDIWWRSNILKYFRPLSVYGPLTKMYIVLSYIVTYVIRPDH